MTTSVSANRIDWGRNEDVIDKMVEDVVDSHLRSVKQALKKIDRNTRMMILSDVRNEDLINFRRVFSQYKCDEQSLQKYLSKVASTLVYRTASILEDIGLMFDVTREINLAKRRIKKYTKRINEKRVYTLTIDDIV